VRLTVPPRALLLLLPVAVLLVGVSAAMHLWGLATPGGVPFDGYERLLQVLDADAETTLPTWFSTAVLLVGALLLLDAARTARALGDRAWRSWAVLAAAFAYLSADEGSRLHEAGSALLDRAGVDTGLRFSWVVVALPLVVALAVAMVPFLRRLPRRTAGALLLAGAFYVGGAVGLEVVSGAVVDATAVGSAPYVLVSSLEELCEMVGAVLLAWAVADHQDRLLGAGVTEVPARAAAPAAQPAAAS
jgi:hypothetical protein